MPRFETQRAEVRRRSRSDAEPEFVLAVDLGYACDYTAVVLMQGIEDPDDPVRQPDYHVRGLKRFALRTESPVIIDDLCDYVNWRPVRDKIRVVVDASGNGRPIAQEMVRAGLRPVPLVITAGAAISGNHISKQVLVSRLKLCMEQRRLKVSPHLPLSTEFKKEFQNFQAKLSATGNWRYGAAAGQHDDILMATAMAVHFFEARRRPPQVRATIFSAQEGTSYGAAWDSATYRAFNL